MTLPPVRRLAPTTSVNSLPPQRSDVCAVPAAGVVAEAMVALVLAEAALEKFGGDSIGETRRNMDSYLEAIPASLAWESNVAGWDA